MPLPLHVFEPRYRALVRDALETHRTIGMALLRPGYETEYEARPPIYPLGCVGAIVEEERLADGRYNLVLRGRSRFRVLEERDGGPYRLARVEALCETKGDGDSLGRVKQGLLEAFERLTGSALLEQGDVPPEALVNGLCQQLDLPAVEKLALLGCDSLESRALRLVELLEFHKLERDFGRSAEPN